MFANKIIGSVFRREFFSLFPQQPKSSKEEAAVAAQPSQRISYSEAVHGSYEEFCRSPLFLQLRDEMRAIMDTLIRFGAHDGLTEATKKTVIDGFNHLFDRRFNQTFMVHYAKRIDSMGKRSLDRIVELIGNEAIPLDIRRTAVLNLSSSVDVCSGGTISNLIIAERSLLMSIGGIRARLWKMKEDVVRDVLVEAVRRQFGHERNYDRSEIHYVNAVWNYLSDEVGLEWIRDSFAPNLVKKYADFLNACREKVFAAITPEKLANILAEQCLSSFIRQAAPDGEGMEGRCTEGYMNVLEVALNEILLDLRLGSDRLTLHAFVQFDDSYQHYRLRTNFTLISLALLDAIHAERLMDEMPMVSGEWRDEHGQRAVLLSHASLAWKSYVSDGVPINAAWSIRKISPELLTIADLRAWKAMRRQDVPRISIAALRATIRSADPAELLDVPVDWLADTETAVTLLKRLEPDAANRYLNSHLPYFLNDFPYNQRASFIDEVMGAWDAVSTLARLWYPDPWTMLDEAHRGNSTTRLHRWMTQRKTDAIDAVRRLAENGWSPAESPRQISRLILKMLRGSKDRSLLCDAMVTNNTSAIGAWRRLVSSPAVLPYVQAALFELLTADRPQDLSALSAAMQQNCAKAVAEFRLLLIDPAILPKIQAKLPSIVAGIGGRFYLASKGRHALTIAMERNSASAIREYGKILADQAIFPSIRFDLVGLFNGVPTEDFRANRQDWQSPLWSAMNYDHADAVGAFHKILITPHILKCLGDQLPNLFAGKSWRVRASPLHAALDGGCASGIRAFQAMVVDPAINPLIAGALPNLLAAQDALDRPGLAMALRYGHASAIEAFHAMVAHDAILPYIERHLPGLLQCLPAGEVSGLAMAVAAGNTKSVQAFQAMLIDPKVLPKIHHALPTLLIARRVSGMKGLTEARRAGHTETSDAYRDMLVHPGIAPHIKGAIKQRMLESRWAAAAQGRSHGRTWDEEVDRWLAFYIDDRSSEPGLFTRMMSHVQSSPEM